MATTSDAELMRHVALEGLVHRHPTALPPAAIKRKVQPELGHQVSDDELLSVLTYLVDKELVTTYWDELGSTRYYQATSKGVDLVERNSNLP